MAGGVRILALPRFRADGEEGVSGALANGLVFVVQKSGEGGKGGASFGAELGERVGFEPANVAIAVAQAGCERRHDNGGVATDVAESLGCAIAEVGVIRGICIVVAGGFGQQLDQKGYRGAGLGTELPQSSGGLPPDIEVLVMQTSDERGHGVCGVLADVSESGGSGAPDAVISQFLIRRRIEKLEKERHCGPGVPTVKTESVKDLRLHFRRVPGISLKQMGHDQRRILMDTAQGVGGFDPDVIVVVIERAIQCGDRTFRAIADVAEARGGVGADLGIVTLEQSKEVRHSRSGHGSKGLECGSRIIAAATSKEARKPVVGIGYAKPPGLEGGVVAGDPLQKDREGVGADLPDRSLLRPAVGIGAGFESIQPLGERAALVCRLPRPKPSLREEPRQSCEHEYGEKG
jgi:hypothetical protein